MTLSDLTGLEATAGFSESDAGKLKSGQEATVTFDAVAGTTYRIAVDGYNGASGDIVLGLGYTYVFSTYAGESSYGTADGPGELARFDHPWSVAVDSSGTVYVADTVNHTIRKITSARFARWISGCMNCGRAAKSSCA